jgi:hypothetical protein
VVLREQQYLLDSLDASELTVRYVAELLHDIHLHRRKARMEEAKLSAVVKEQPAAAAREAQVDGQQPRFRPNQGLRAWKHLLKDATTQDVQHALAALGINDRPAPVGAVGSGPRPASTGAGGAGGLATYKAVQGGQAGCKHSGTGLLHSRHHREPDPVKAWGAGHPQGAYCRMSNPKHAHQDPKFRPPPRDNH